jgi:endonuclease/exonuclease/phosphatase family metal-dependent hydrolase
MLRLMSYNIRFGGAGREKQIAAVIRQAEPDVVVLQEASRPDVVERLAELAYFPYRAIRNGQSNCLISRIPILHQEWLHTAQIQRSVLSVDLEGLRVYGVHLRATHSNYTERVRMREVHSLLDLAKGGGDGFHVLAGDFNTLAPGELLDMRKLPMRYRILAMALGGRVKYRALQLMLDGGYVDCYRSLHTDEGFTFPAWDPHVRIDYVFTPRHHASRVATCRVMSEITDPAKATDHLPLIAEVAIDRTA